MASTSPQITFYDIASAPPLRTFGPNPWKTRLALNYKGISYQTQWIQMPDITAVREKLGVPANRTLPDGTPYHTLPVIQDSSTGALIGDSFEIARYLDTTYSDNRPLFRPLCAGLTAAFNAQVDGLFTKHTALCSNMPFDPEHEGAIYTIFAKRAGVESLDQLQLSAPARAQMLQDFEAALGELAKAYAHTGGTTDWIWRKGGSDERQRQRGREVSVWLDGEEPVYADFIVGAWLKMMEASLPKDDWGKMREWQGGLWGKIVDALQPWCAIM